MSNLRDIDKYFPLHPLSITFTKTYMYKGVGGWGQGGYDTVYVIVHVAGIDCILVWDSCSCDILCMRLGLRDKR